MKKILLVSLLFTLCSGILMAQGKQNAQKTEKKSSKVGSFLKRTGEVATGINMTNEPFVVNPLKSAVNVEFVGAYGDPTTGEVSIVFKVMNKTYAKSVTFSGNLDKTAAFDKSGKTYKTNLSTGLSFDAPKGIWTEIRLAGKTKGAFLNVPEMLAAFELINMYCYVDANNRGLIEFRNIPIIWQTVNINEASQK